MTKIQVKFTIPDGLEFSDLHLSRDPETGEVEFNLAPIEKICEASGVDISLFLDQSEENLANLLAHWYTKHRKRGGISDPVADDILAEVLLENKYGDAISHKPGRA